MLVLGVDLSTEKLSAVLLDSEGRYVAYELRAEGKLAATRFVPLALWFDGLLANETVSEAQVIYVEGLPFVKSRAAIVGLGCVLGMIRAIAALRGKRCEVVDGRDWKQGLGLGGNASKEKISAWVDANCGQPEPLTSQDLRDAYAIARYAMKCENP